MPPLLAKIMLEPLGARPPADSCSPCSRKKGQASKQAPEIGLCDVSRWCEALLWAPGSGASCRLCWWSNACYLENNHPP